MTQRGNLQRVRWGWVQHVGCTLGEHCGAQWPEIPLWVWGAALLGDPDVSGGGRDN